MDAPLLFGIIDQRFHRLSPLDSKRSRNGKLSETPAAASSDKTCRLIPLETSFPGYNRGYDRQKGTQQGNKHIRNKQHQCRVLTLRGMCDARDRDLYAQLLGINTASSEEDPAALDPYPFLDILSYPPRGCLLLFASTKKSGHLGSGQSLFLQFYFSGW